MQTPTPCSVVEALARLLGSKGIAVLQQTVQAEALPSNVGLHLYSVVAADDARPAVAEVLTRATGRAFRADTQAWVLDQQEAARIIQAAPEHNVFEVPRWLQRP